MIHLGVDDSEEVREVADHALVIAVFDLTELHRALGGSPVIYL